MNNFHMPVFVHPQITKLANSNLEVLSRLNVYSKAYQEFSGSPNVKLLVLLGINASDFIQIQKSEFESLEIVRVSNPTNNFLLYALKCKVALLKFKVAPTIVIAGDLGIGLLSTLLLARLYKNRVYTQISIHGFISYQGYSKGNFKVLVKRTILRAALMSIDSIRVVSEPLKTYYSNLYFHHKDKIFSAPIPILDYPKFSQHKSPNLVVGVVGRLHEERNVYEILQILDLVLPERRVEKVLIVGSGPLSHRVENWVFKNSNTEKVSYLGELNRPQLNKIWDEITVLLSCALNEGYGLSIREAVVSGSLVVARENFGTLQARALFPKSIKLYQSVKEAGDLILDSERNFVQISEDDTVNVQKALDATSLQAIARSWVAGDKRFL